MLLGKRARHALEMMDVFIKEVMEETCQKTIGGGADEPIPLEMSRIVLDLNR